MRTLRQSQGYSAAGSRAGVASGRRGRDAGGDNVACTHRRQARKVTGKKRRAMPQGDMFLKVEGARSGAIKGEARDETHREEIDILSWSWGMRAQTAMGGAGRASRASLSELRITKRVDSASTALMAAMRNNDLLNKSRAERTQGRRNRARVFQDHAGKCACDLDRGAIGRIGRPTGADGKSQYRLSKKSMLNIRLRGAMGRHAAACRSSRKPVPPDCRT